MKISTALFCAALFFLSTGFTSETVKGAKKDYEAFRQEMSAKLEATERKLSELKDQAKTKGGDAKEKTIRDLEKTRDDLKAQLENAKSEGGSRWRQFKKKFAESVDHLNNKIQKAASD